jgi:WD40 repeat protein
MFKHQAHHIESLDLSPNGRLLVAAPFPSPVVLWNVRDGSRRTLCGGLGWSVSVSFSPDGRYIAAGDRDGILIWDARTAQLVTKCQFGLGETRLVLFTPDGKGIATGSDTLQCWDFSLIKDFRSESGPVDIKGQLEPIFELKGRRFEVCYLVRTHFQCRY